MLMLASSSSHAKTKHASDTIMNGEIKTRMGKGPAKRRGGGEVPGNKGVRPVDKSGEHVKYVAEEYWYCDLLRFCQYQQQIYKHSATFS
jgi:hypothetical protein